jgi:hypothetical protein
MARIGTVARVVGTLGAWVIYALIWLFGRARRRADVDWLVGPLGGKTIGDNAYRETAEREGLTLERDHGQGGLVPDFRALAAPGFEQSKVNPLVQEFY